ncbi:sigma factor-like helix-turn-helix DNA-binding protein [Nonomuraea thailandensis]|uniref:sigma factor-like helix-turn-helix DNA-binding protein n=1 Tax=Nonomuraea thailandensis TaxID=1188745 RepID=UPI0020A555DE|nr:sigma factor-like helix-turn-helix DNA-binding protein [Nonomuraea thailandensis]
MLVRRHYEDLPDDEIAAILGISRRTVRSQAFRALATLRIRPVVARKGTHMRSETSRGPA